ncbi:O-acyltransferase like protein-like isoform X2 [Anopheles funestus]|uniref:O-acyltransferase like protein-like isoform X2 n=1 Tax=Anopheles funestus TaxID=62324 RepID=UPI0020C61B12|nr:O-acyltransferase like protein-like isoform X2 [Anopheles funestus]
MFCILIIAVIVGCCATTSANEVELMQIYQYDDYEECRQTYSDFVYCSAKAHLTSNLDSMLWTNIKNYSAHPRHFDRRTIEVGACVQKCIPTFESAIHNLSAELQRCVEKKIWSQYELNSSIEIMRCIHGNKSTKNNNPELGIAQIAFLCFAIGTIMVVMLASLSDTEQQECTAEKTSSFTTKLMQSFSLARNLPKLLERENKPGINLRHLDGIRALTMLIILLTHSSIPLIRMPLKNANDLEAQFDQSWFPMAMAGNTYTVQIFFVIGGLLLAVNTLEQLKNRHNVGLAYLLDRVKIRLIRILPLYLFVILFHASWYPHLYQGPIGDRFHDHCTTNWWTNVVFLNNYINPSEPCIQFAWYLGADFQLYLLGTVLMMLMRIQKAFKPMVVCMTLSAFLVPMVVIYSYHLDATVMMILRYILQEIRTLPYYLKVYIPFETNAGNYFFGMLAGIAYFNFKDNPTATSTLKLNYLLPGSAAFFIVMNSLTMMLPSDHLTEPSIGLALYGSLLKSAWGLFPSVLLLYIAFQKRPSMLVATLQHPILLVGSKLSYSIYLVQYAIVYGVYKHVTYPLVYNGFTILIFTAAIVNITFCVAFTLHLFIELPFNLFLKAISTKPKSKA